MLKDNNNTTNDTADTRIQAYLLDLFVERAKILVPSLFFLYPAVTIFVRNSAALPELIIWGSCGIFLALIQYSFVLFLSTQRTATFDYLAEHEKTVKAVLLAIYALLGLVWGYALYQFVSVDDFVGSLGLYAISWAVILGSLFLTTSYAFLFVIMMPGVLIAMTVGMLGETVNVVDQWVIGILLGVGGIFMVGVAYRFQQSDYKKARLFFENEDLVQAVKAEKTAVEKLSITKGRMLAVASHDLRQPVQSLKLLVNALKHAKDSTSAKGLVEDVEGSVQNLSDLLESVLDLSRLESGQIKVEKYPTYIEELFAQLEQDYVLRAEQKGLTLRVFPIAEALETDPVLFYRLLSNLLDNAIKYTQEGSVMLQAKRDGEQVVVEVIDTGVGIPSDKQEVIFEEFAQLKDGNGDESSQGLGLGLSICARLSALLGHKLSLTSTVGGGSTVSLHVDSVKVQLVDASDTVMLLKDKNVLVVGKDRKVRAQLRTQLESWGAMVLEATTQSEALFVIGALEAPIAFVTCEYDIDGAGEALLKSVVDALGYRVPAILLISQGEAEVPASVEIPHVILAKKEFSGDLRAAVEEISGMPIAG